MTQSLPTFYSPSPDRESVILRLANGGIGITNWLSYSFNEHFLTPSDAWSFEVSGSTLTDEQKGGLVPGALVQLLINGNIQSTGYIDSIERKASRTGGTLWTISGRDRFGQIVDACADPTIQFDPLSTLDQAMLTIFGPFGYTASQILVDNDDNRALQTGQISGTKTSAKGKPLKSYALHQYRPYPREGLFEFAARICQRRGLWIWPSSDGTKVIVGRPNFDQSSFYRLVRQAGGQNDILDGSVKYDLSNQPCIIVADGFSGGADFAHAKMMVIGINPAVRGVADKVDTPLTSTAAYRAVLARFPQAVTLPPLHPATSYPQMIAPSFRTIYLHDDEAKTQAELNSFVYREMALRLRSSLHVTYTVEGHGMLAQDGSFTPWAVDTMVDVQDDVGGVYEPLYVLSRTFHKSRSGGTKTDLELIRRYSLDLG